MLKNSENIGVRVEFGIQASFLQICKYDKRIEEHFTTFSVKVNLEYFCSVFNDNTLQKKGLPWSFKLGPL